MDGVEGDLKAGWVKRVLGFEIPRASIGEPPGLDVAELRGELNRLGIEIGNNRADPAFAALTPQLRAGIEALKTGDLVAANKAVQSLEEAMTALRSAARGKTAVGSGPSLRLVATASLNWRRALSTADDELAELKDAVIAAAEADEELDEDDVEEIADQLDNFDDIPLALADLTAALEDLAAAEGPGRVDAIRDLLDEVKDTRAYLTADAWVKSLDDAGVMSVSFVSTCLGVLDELEKAAA